MKAWRTAVNGKPPLCLCNCGGTTKPHPATRRYAGWVKGVTHYDFIYGHHAKLQTHGSSGSQPTEARREKGRLARTLVHDEGLTYRQAAAEMGVTLGTFGHYISDLDGSKARACGAASRKRRKELDPVGYTQRNAARCRRWRANRMRRDTPLDHTTARAADGPKLAAWLDARSLELTAHQRRTVLRWRNGSLAQIDAIDRLLVHHGRDLSEVPDDFWLERARP